MNLLELSLDTKAQVVEIQAGKVARKRLIDMGIIPGAKIRVTQGNATGPVVVEIHSGRVAIGRGLASQVTVEPITEAENKKA